MPSEKRTQSLARLTLRLAAFCIAVVALLFHVDQMFLMAAALFLLPWASWLIGQVVSGGVTCERRLASLCAVGEVTPVMLTLTNTGRLPKLYLRVADRLPNRLRPIGERAPLILQLRPGESREVTYFLEPERRGRFQIGPAVVETTDPLGFHGYQQRVGGLSDLAVHPRPLPLRRVFFEEAAAPGWRSQDDARTRGLGTEFHGVREYQPGDELRHVHWRTTARTGRLSVAEYAHGASRDAVVALDLSREAYADTGEDRESALEYAVTLAVSLCDFLLRRGYAVRLLTPADWDDPAPPAAGLAQMPRVLETLVRAEADASLGLAEVLARAGLRPVSGATLVYITPDLGSGLAAALEGWAVRGAPVFGLLLQADTFRTRPGRTVSGGAVPGVIRPVRRGDDLQQVLEG